MRASTVSIDFEGVPDSTSVGALYAGQGLLFSSGIVVVSGDFGGSLNEVDFPPRVPGQAVFLNEANVTMLTFAQPIFSFSGFFSYGGPITINFYEAGNSLLTTLTSGYATNLGTSGDIGSSPNEELAALSLANAVRVEILAPNTDFTLDDLSFSTDAADTSVPEPGSGLLVICGAGILLACRSRRRING